MFVFFLTACSEIQPPAPVVNYRPGQGAGAAGIHTVSKGETLWNISKRYNVAPQDIAQYNHISAPFYLFAGQRLKLPPPQEYRVRSGDSVRTVSRLFGVGPSEITRMNDLRPPYVLRSGQVLRLPFFTRKSAEEEVTAQIASAPVASTPEVIVEPLAPPRPSSPSARTPSSQWGEGWGEGEAWSAGGEKVAALKKPIPKSPISAQPPPRASKKFMRPVSGKIISGYGPKADGLYNDGVNIKAPLGAPVRAADNGVVVYADDELRGSGNLVLIRHADRWMTAYAHMNNILVKRGDALERGQVIGAVGSTGSVDSPQLHFEVRRGADALNPAAYLEN